MNKQLYQIYMIANVMDKAMEHCVLDCGNTKSTQFIFTFMWQDRLAKLRFLKPQSHLLSENQQKEIQFAVTWFGPLPDTAKLQYLINPEDLDRKWEMLKHWDPESKFRSLQCLVAKTKGKQGDVEMFMKAATLIGETPEFLVPLQEHLHPTCKALHDWIWM